MVRLGWLAVVLCGISTAAQAGISIVWEYTGGEGVLPSTVAISCEGARVRMEPTMQGRAVLILWDGDAQVMTITDPAGKTFQRINQTQLKAMMEQTQNMFSGPQGAKLRAAMEKQLEKLPPEQRAQVQEMLEKSQGKGGPAKPEGKWRFTPAGKSDQVAGYDCERYVGKRGAQTQELCVVPWSRSPIQRDDFHCFDSFNEVSKSSPFGSVEAGQRDFSLYPGFPVQTVMGAGERKITTTVKSLKKEKLAAELFEPPAGYTEQQAPGMMMRK